MLNIHCLTLTAAANTQAKTLIAGTEGTKRLGWRFSSTGSREHVFEPLAELCAKDYVLQPILGGVVVFVTPESMEKGYGTDIDWDGEHWVFSQSDRVMPKVEPKSDEMIAEEKARRKRARALKNGTTEKEATSPRMSKKHLYVLTFEGEGDTPADDMAAIVALKNARVVEYVKANVISVEATDNIKKLVSTMKQWSIMPATKEKEKTTTEKV